MLKKIALFLGQYWNIWGAIILSSIISWIDDFSKGSMDTATSYLVLTLTCIGLLTFLKTTVFKNKKSKNSSVETVVMNQRSIKAVKIAVDPIKSGEELGEAIVKTAEISGKVGKAIMSKLKSFLKAIWGNKFTITNTIIVIFMATLSQVMTYTDTLYNIDWFAQNEIVIKVISPIIALIFTVVDLYTTYTKYGFESLEELKERKLSKLTKEQKATLKSQISLLKNTLKSAKVKYDEYSSLIENTKTLVSVGYILSTSERNAYDIARNSIDNIHNTIQNLEKQIATLEEKI